MSDRERSRSPLHRSRSRDGKGYVGRDTNSNDAQSIRCRVFIGNLATDKCTKADIEELFAKYGRIVSCSLHANFGFVQFADEQGADEAVNALHGTTLFGKRVDVNLAGLRRKQQTKDKFEPLPDAKSVGPSPLMSRLPKQSTPPRERSPARRGRSPVPRERSPPHPRSKSPPINAGRDIHRSLSPMSRYEQFYRKDDMLSRPDDRYDRREDYSNPSYEHRDLARVPYHSDHRVAYGPRYDRDFSFRDDPYRRPYDAPHVPALPLARPAIDCEIVCLEKENSRYAEEVESRLRSIGLVCNIGYPAPELPIAAAVDRIARSGTLYAMVLQSTNVQYRSVTLNVLRGTRQEHRNMPLEDALSFVARNFDMFLQGVREPPPFRGQLAAPTPMYRDDSRSSFPARPMPDVSALLKDETVEKRLTTDELVALIEKLKKEKDARSAGGQAEKPEDDKRRLQLEEELRDLQDSLNAPVTKNSAGASSGLRPPAPANGSVNATYPLSYYQSNVSASVPSTFGHSQHHSSAYPNSNEYGGYGGSSSMGPPVSSQSGGPIYPEQYNDQQQSRNYHHQQPSFEAGSYGQSYYR